MANTEKKKKKVKAFEKKKKTNTLDVLQASIEQLKTEYDTIDVEKITSFSELPLSKLTKKGLQKMGYSKPTAIQLQSLKNSLKGSDILGAAQTGSGKTLAFLIPLLELLYCQRWNRCDGVGAIVITPTRELAYQIFEELRKVGEFHDFSAGLIIGGKDLKFEKGRMDQCNIVICTPGRLLQHMDENPLFNCDNMKVLVLDEADRILDLGFADTMNSILANLPPDHQTLLFSATQTKSVKDLARLSLKDPCYVSVHENLKHSTPENLQQSYMICDLDKKISVLYSFIRNHLKSKIIIFFSSCKQTKYIYEIFCKLRPGMSLLALYGTLHQLRRMDIYEQFCSKTNAVLFATDLAARGLDFPKVNWVVQADCPEDPETYIHRVGRTARYQQGGESLLLLLPSEEAMLVDLEKYKIPVEKIDINPERLTNPVRKMEAYLAKDPNLKDSAQRAFKSYLKAIYLMKNKKVFNVQALDTVEYAHSLGLAVAPRIRFLEKLVRKDGVKVQNAQITQPKESLNNVIKFESDEDTEEVAPTPSSSRRKFDDDSDAEDGDNLLQIKRADHDIEIPANMEEASMFSKKKGKPITKAALARKMLNKQIVPNNKVVFDDEGEMIIDAAKHKKSQMAQDYENEEADGINIETARLVLKEEDQYDKQLFKERVRAKKKELKRKLKQQKKKDVKEEEEMDEFGTDSDDGSGVDLSWLPDPDKVYGPADSDFDESETFEKASEKLKMKKRKSTSDESKKIVKRKKKSKIEDTSLLNVDEAEQLALTLLKS